MWIWVPSSAFAAGLGCGVIGASAVGLLLLLLLIPEQNGGTVRAGFAAVNDWPRTCAKAVGRSDKELQERASKDTIGTGLSGLALDESDDADVQSSQRAHSSKEERGNQARQARWAARSNNVHRLIGSVSNSVIAGLKFADAACYIGFGLGIGLTRLSFFLGRKSLHIIDLGLAKTHRWLGGEVEHDFQNGNRLFVSLVERLLGLIHFLDETVYYAELITMFALRATKLIVRVSLRGSLQMLELYHFMSPRGALQATLGAISSICFEVQTLEALMEIASMGKVELGPITESLRFSELAASLKTLAAFCNEGPHAMTVATMCKNARLAPSSVASNGNSPSESESSIGANAAGMTCVSFLDDLDNGPDIARFVMFAVGMYGQMGLKFLGIVPYGSVTSDAQALAYCTRLGSTSQVLVSHFDGNIYLPGYAVCVDHSTKSLVVTIRGSIHPLDFLSDLVCEPVSVRLMGIEGSAHKGMYRAAVNLDSKLRATILDLLSSDNQMSSYRLVLTGHSLGAGAAVLLAALWLSGPDPLLRDPMRLRVYGFGTPQVLSPDIACLLSDNVTSVIMGNDMVPRFSLQSFQRLRDRALDLSYSDNTVGSSAQAEGRVSPPAWWEERLDTSSHVAQLVPPGTLVWIDDSALEQERVQVLLSGDGTFACRHFNDMIVSNDMFLAHLPQHYAILGDVPFPSHFL